jgi:hypothetical protein
MDSSSQHRRLKQQDTCPILSASFIENAHSDMCRRRRADTSLSTEAPAGFVHSNLELRTYLDAIIATTSDLAELEQL